MRKKQNLNSDGLAKSPSLSQTHNALDRTFWDAIKNNYPYKAGQSAAIGLLCLTTAHPNQKNYPSPAARCFNKKDVMKQILLKMPEPLYLKLRHIANLYPVQLDILYPGTDSAEN